MWQLEALDNGSYRVYWAGGHQPRPENNPRYVEEENHTAFASARRSVVQREMYEWSVEARYGLATSPRDARNLGFGDDFGI